MKKIELIPRVVGHPSGSGMYMNEFELIVEHEQPIAVMHIYLEVNDTAEILKHIYRPRTPETGVWHTVRFLSTQVPTRVKVRVLVHETIESSVEWTDLC